HGDAASLVPNEVPAPAEVRGVNQSAAGGIQFRHEGVPRTVDRTAGVRSSGTTRLESPSRRGEVKRGGTPRYIGTACGVHDDGIREVAAAAVYKRGVNQGGARRVEFRNKSSRVARNLVRRNGAGGLEGARSRG